MIFAFGLVAVAVANMMDRYDGAIPSIVYQGNMVPRKPFSIALESEPRINMTWWLQPDLETIHFKLDFDDKVANFTWFSLGFSDRGKLDNADVMLVKLGDDVSVMDVVSDATGAVSPHKKQENHNVAWNPDEKIMMLARSLARCDMDKYTIEEGTTHMLWARGASAEPNLKTHTMKPIQLVKYDERLTTKRSNETKELNIVVGKYTLPKQEFVSYCSIQELPAWLTAKDHHLIRYDPIISKGSEKFVHFMELLYCDAPSVKLASGDCLNGTESENFKLCSALKATWANGAGPFIYPDDVGSPLGGPGANKQVMLRMTYHKPEAGVTDSSGFQLFLTPQPRKYNSSILELGVTTSDKMAIPPTQPHFTLAGECLANCSGSFIPEEGLTAFGSQFYTNSMGVKVKTRHFRNGIELPHVSVDNHYDTSLLETRLLRKFAIILPGDALKTECVYDSESQKGLTFVGRSNTEEKCINHIHYYPAINLGVCKSSVSTNSLKAFFANNRTARQSANNTDESWKDKYNKMAPWDEAKVTRLRNLYNNLPVDAQCLHPSGKEVEGAWLDLERAPVLEPLPPSKPCDPVKPGQTTTPSSVHSTTIDCSIKDFIRT